MGINRINTFRTNFTLWKYVKVPIPNWKMIQKYTSRILEKEKKKISNNIKRLQNTSIEYNKTILFSDTYLNIPIRHAYNIIGLLIDIYLRLIVPTSK